MVDRLRNRAVFVALQGAEKTGGGRWSTPGFLLIGKPRREAALPARVGFTVTKKIGTAVVRNRLKRRLRALVQADMAKLALPGCDYVLIGREAGLRHDFAQMQADLAIGLGKLAKSMNGPLP